MYILHYYIFVAKFKYYFKVKQWLVLFVLQKNSAIAGAVTGVTLALTSEETSHEQIVHGAITGAAISTAANLLSSIF